jgi:hypothetical protein
MKWITSAGFAAVLLCALLSGCSSPAGRGGADAGTARPADAALLAPDASSAPVLVPAVDVSVWTRTLTDPDVDCLWDLGYRHIIAGTQLLEVTREQLEIARRGGMTVDLYVYLYWSQSMSEQVAEAVALAEEFPAVGRIWLDIEDDPGGRGPAALRDLIDEGIAALEGAPGGIYTGKGWWQSYFEDSESYAEQPLWYARYDGEATLDGWSDPAEEESFGGWTEPTGKQYADYHVHTCELPVDLNVMWVAAAPEVVVDRSIPADDGTPPDAPSDLWPDGGVRVTTEYVRPTAPAIREATSYEIELESWNGSQFEAYWTTSEEVSAVTVFPVHHDRAYRWRMRARNQHGAGAWSAWASFDFGSVTSHPSSAGVR